MMRLAVLCVQGDGCCSIAPATRPRPTVAPMKTLLAAAALALVAFAAESFGQAGIREETIRFGPGESRATVKGSIKGSQTVDYRLRARAGQTMTVALRTTNASAYFNVLPPASDEALFVGSTSGTRFAGALPGDGDYTIRVYLMRNAAPRNETASYTFDVAVTDAAANAGATGGSRAAATPGKPFDATLELKGIRFRVTATNEGSINSKRSIDGVLAPKRRVGNDGVHVHERGHL